MKYVFRIVVVVVGVSYFVFWPQQPSYSSSCVSCIFGVVLVTDLLKSPPKIKPDLGVLCTPVRCDVVPTRKMPVAVVFFLWNSTDWNSTDMCCFLLANRNVALVPGFGTRFSGMTRVYPWLIQAQMVFGVVILRTLSLERKLFFVSCPSDRHVHRVP